MTPGPRPATVHLGRRPGYVRAVSSSTPGAGAADHPPTAVPGPPPVPPPSPPADGPPVEEADVLHHAIEADVTELAGVRASVRAWVPDQPDGAPVGDDAVIVVDELVALAVEASEPGRPVEIRLRRTHSILVAEVDAHVPPRTADELVRRFNCGDPALGGTRVVRLLAYRVRAEAGTRHITLCSTLRFGRPPPPL